MGWLVSTVGELSRHSWLSLEMLCHQAANSSQRAGVFKSSRAPSVILTPVVSTFFDIFGVGKSPRYGVASEGSAPSVAQQFVRIRQAIGVALAKAEKAHSGS